MNRQEHLEWCKERAIEYVERGEIKDAFASFQSDMRKHKETAYHKGLKLMTDLFMGGQLNKPSEMKKCIEGFN